MSETAYSHLSYHQTVLYFQKFGSGNKVLLAFHGYGQNSKAFEKIAETIGTKYTLYSFDLFFHGKSTWPFGSKPLRKTFWTEIIQNFLSSNGVSKFSLAGYSMGGKFVLATLEAFAPKIEEVFLIAPDGIKTNPWYSLATYPVFLRGVFKVMIRFPKPLFTLMDAMLYLRVLERGLIKFARRKMNTEIKRRRVYYSWVVFRHLTFDMEKIAGLINLHDIRVNMVLGKFDKIITGENMQVLVEKLNDCKLIMLETGHNLLMDEFAMHLQKN